MSMETLPLVEFEAKISREYSRAAKQDVKFLSVEVKLPDVVSIPRDGVDENGAPKEPISLVPKFEVQVAQGRAPKAFAALKSAEDGDLIRLKGRLMPQRGRVGGSKDDPGFLKNLAIIEAEEVRILTTRVRTDSVQSAI